MDEAVESSSAQAEGMLKRKRSNSPERAPPGLCAQTSSAKMHKTQPGASIDFLASLANDEPLQLVDIDDPLRFIQQHLEQYSGAVERHESLAANLGARLTAPNMIKRFERLFVHPIKILANHGREGNTVTWLDIVRFYEDRPSQFKLQQKDGETVCQFYTKHCRVEINEDEFEFIRSGQPQKLLPSGTVSADEEKELGTIEFMETKISQIIKLADNVSGRGKVLMTRLKARRNALAAKRENEANGTAAAIDVLGDGLGDTHPSGFTAVNAQATNGITMTSSISRPLVSSAVRTELQHIFAANRERTSSSGTLSSELRSSKSGRPARSDPDYAALLLNAASTPIPASPAIGVSGGNNNNSSHHRPSPAEKIDNDGPYKAEMLSRMEKMVRYAVVRPPCDRCRRLQIDCQKNLTACLGCTRKHAKCSWKEVTEQELRDNPPPTGSGSGLGVSGDGLLRRGSPHGSAVDSEGEQTARETSSGPPLPVRDEELLGEDDSDDDMVGVIPSSGSHDPSATRSVPHDTSADERNGTLASPSNAYNSINGTAGASGSGDNPVLPLLNSDGAAVAPAGDLSSTAGLPDANPSPPSNDRSDSHHLPTSAVAVAPMTPSASPQQQDSSLSNSLGASFPQTSSTQASSVSGASIKHEPSGQTATPGLSNSGLGDVLGSGSTGGGGSSQAGAVDPYTGHAQGYERPALPNGMAKV